jgi:transposase-like protein
MMECERCEAERDRVLRYRAYGGAMTHRVTRWLCPECHPTVPTRGPSASTVETAGSSEPTVTDGGTVTTCPRCAAATADVHGIRNCIECRWSSR